jgi:hypothetical protein
MMTSDVVRSSPADLTRRKLLAFSAVAFLPFLTGGECGPDARSIDRKESFEEALPALRWKFGNQSEAALNLKWRTMPLGQRIFMLDEYDRAQLAKVKRPSAPANVEAEKKTGDGGGGGGGGD